jgi:hypothetical protein
VGQNEVRWGTPTRELTKTFPGEAQASEGQHCISYGIQVLLEGNRDFKLNRFQAEAEDSGVQAHLHQVIRKHRLSKQSMSLQGNGSPPSEKGTVPDTNRQCPVLGVYFALRSIKVPLWANQRSGIWWWENSFRLCAQHWSF